MRDTQTNDDHFSHVLKGGCNRFSPLLIYHPVEGGMFFRFFLLQKTMFFYIFSVVNQIGLPSTMCSTDLTQELRSSLQSYALCRLLWTPPWWGRCERWAAVGPSSVVGVRQNNGNLKSISSAFKGYFSGRFEFRWGSSFGEVRVYSISTRHFNPSLTDFESWLVARENLPCREP